MLTGVYPHAHGLTENDGRFGGRPNLDPTDWLLHQPLLQNGYRCAWFGKWHLDNRRSAQDFGFEGYSLPGYGYPYGTLKYREYLRRIDCTSPMAAIELPGESGIAPGTRVNMAEGSEWFDYESGTAILDGPADSHEAFFLSSLAKDWIGNVGDEPFFLRVDPWGPHPPYLVAQSFVGAAGQDRIELSANFDFGLGERPSHHRRYRDYWSRTLGFDVDQWSLMAVRSLEHAALVESALAGVLVALEQAGMAERTFVIFCSDHGDAIASNGGVANKGGLMVEETMRIPLLLRGPGIPAGTASDHLVSSMDVAPTLLEISGISVNREMHGKSLAPLFDNPTAEWRVGLLAQHYGLDEAISQRAYYEKNWKLVVQEDGFQELYDLDTDPCETRSLVSRDDHAQMLEHMRSRLRANMLKYGDSGHRLFETLSESR